MSKPTLLDWKTTLAAAAAAGVAYIGLRQFYSKGKDKKDESNSGDESNPSIGDASRQFKYPQDVRRQPDRKTPAPDPKPEIKGDVFDRQRVMVDWDQGKAEEQVCLVLGTGGLGQSVALALARIGVQEIIMLDMDVYDATNCNRQILGGFNSHGKRKVDVGREGIEVHNLRSKITTMHMNGVTHWGEIVEAAKRCTGIFNCIDYGATFDCAVNSLCKRLCIPYISGSSYANSMILNVYTGKVGRQCWSCNNSGAESFTDNNACADDLKKWAEEHKITGALTPSEVAVYLKEKNHMSDVPGVSLASCVENALKGLGMTGLLPADFNAFKPIIVPSDPSDAKSTPKTVKKRFSDSLRDQVHQLLAPSLILSYKDISFIPKDKSFPTRTVGSWVCVCTGAALQMVNAFCQDVIFNRGDFPTWAQFNLHDFTADNSLATGGVCTSDSSCRVCKEQAACVATWPKVSP